MSFSRHLPSCFVRSAGHRALCAASQAQNGRLASVYASRSRELQRQDEPSEVTSHKDGPTVVLCEGAGPNDGSDRNS